MLSVLSNPDRTDTGYSDDMPAVLGQLTLDSSYDDVANAIVQESFRRGHQRVEAVAELATGIQESSLRPRAVSANGKWKGVYQQDTSYPGRDNANEQIREFMNRLDVKRRSPNHGDIWGNIFWLQQRPGEPSAAAAYANGRKAYMTEIKSRTAEAERLVAKYWPADNPSTPTPGGTAPVVARPDFNEINEIDGTHASPRSRPPINFFLHTQEGNGNAQTLAAYLRSTSGAGAVSYHYTVHEDPNDHGVTVVDVVDTDYYSWSVLDANVFSINLCFAGSYAAWTREQWLSKASRAIDVAAYLAVEDCKKYPTIAADVILPPYTNRPGISDHRYVTKCLGIGTHTDVGGPMQAPWTGFPWDVFQASVNKYAGVPVGAPEPAQPTFEQWLAKASEVDLLRYVAEQLGPGHPAWESKGMTLRDKLWSLGT
ncbi:lysin A [Mycobacterium phage Compostia]|nr:lysin A [Mycobacterium phage Compostia]